MMNRKLQLSISLFLLVISFSSTINQTVAQPKKTVTANRVEIVKAQKINGTTVELQLSNRYHILIDFYGENIFRLFYDSAANNLRDPQATPTAQILVDHSRLPISNLSVTNSGNEVAISTGKIHLLWNKTSSTMEVINPENRSVVEMIAPIQIDKKGTRLKLKEMPEEYFYGGGVQNGRFSHKGKSIAIENQNSWTDGGVASPTPFYWSTNGYGMMWYTFKKGRYDFGASEKGVVNLSHETPYLDVFVMINQEPAALLNDFYQLTGHPVLLPKFSFYEGHLNAYNRDYWKQDSTGILFEDGLRYKESQKDNGGIKESLSGKKNNYQFSARAVIDRYKAHDMPLGWILPNDGYGAGYGQTTTLDSNILNLQSFGNYARKNGVQIGLWTQSDLYPIDTIAPLLQRDIVKEVGVAGVRVLKTDVAWVGRGYSFGLNGVADAAQITSKNGNNARPFIITLDGWAGTQRYGGIWTGDQTGGVWEYIRFHIPTYLGSGLSGIPNITSDMDGIFGGKNPIVNTRDFQWKTFTPMQLNMDGWGANEKYPHALGEPTTSINRLYLKWKSALLPYTYSIAKEAVNGLPMIRPMFLNYPNTYTLGKATQYQYLYGPNFLVAPIYKDTKADAQGNDIRNGIYLPAGTWIDYFTGDQYEGGKILNHFETPIWKLPVFVKSGAIIPMTLPNNHVTEINKSLRVYEVYPAGKTSFIEYDDDGLTEAYKEGKGVTTLIESSVTNNTATITINAAKGSFDGFVKDKATQFRINVTQPPTAVKAKVGSRVVTLKKATSKENFENSSNAYYYDEAPNLNQFATTGSAFEKTVITKNPQLLVKVKTTDITKNPVTLTISGFRFAPTDHLHKSTGALNAPAQAVVLDSNATAYTLNPTWRKVANADYYEIVFNNQLYTNIRDTTLLFDDLVPETAYAFKVRSVNKTGNSPWSSITAKTKMNPLEFAIKGIVGEATTGANEGEELSNLFDMDESSMWHTKYSAKAVPFDLVLDLHSVNQLDKLQYVPRSRGNGIILKGTIAYSIDKEKWQGTDSLSWARNGETKEYRFANHPSARYIKISVTDAVGGFGSGRELYVFKVPGSESFIPGDINNDHKIDRNDLTSYVNYTGLRKGDGDFDGYISKGDINKNDLIDAYDISNVATLLEGGIITNETDSVRGTLTLNLDKKSYNKDETIEVKVRGVDMKAVNALSFAMPYNSQDVEFISIVPINMKNMENMTNDRLHSSGQKALYPTFVNVGDKETLNGTTDLFVIKLKAKRKVNVDLKLRNGLLVDKHLHAARF
jgi:alpha-glucosidase (family GH31 glycosyl hydrolase)